MRHLKSLITLAATVGIGAGFIIATSASASETSENQSETAAARVTSTLETYSANGVDFEMLKIEGTSTGTYSIGRFEVTQELWSAVMGANPSRFRGDNLPVESISWEECQLFIKKLNKVTGFNFRLPSESEWRNAATECAGREPDGYRSNENAWYAGNSRRATHAVGGKRPNSLGLYDMEGNVWEWCQDSRREGSDLRICCGGSWNNNRRYSRPDGRLPFNKGYCSHDIGLRLAL